MIESCGTRPGNHADVETGRQAVQLIAEKLPYQALDPIALHSPANLAADRQSKPGGTVFSQQRIHDKMRTVAASSFSAGQEEFVAATHPVRLGKTASPMFHVGLFDGDGHHQTFTPLGAAPPDDRLSVLAPHAGSEAMGSFTADTTRLISPF